MVKAELDLDREESAYLERARNGDTLAFEWLYRRHVGRVYALCLRMTAEVTLAEECTQRCFIRAWTRLGDFRGDSKLTTWLHSIAINEVLGARRASGRDRAVLVSVSDEERDSAIVANDAGDEMDLERTIAKLPERARHVFVLIAIHGYTHDEAGALLGVAEGTCKAQYHRARRLLAERLGHSAGESMHA
ncbi:MAG: RNA polymerase sigma factor [Gammaproteobacteria bacterium]|nr:RNA polymerase sigma factor [Gammaproteobacteria bacterium]